MANTKLKKKKKGVIGVNGLNNDAGNTQVVCDILVVTGGSVDRRHSVTFLTRNWA